MRGECHGARRFHRIISFSDQASYLTAVTAAGSSHLLVQRQVDAYGHCEFTPDDIGTAFTDLVLWVQFGIKPGP